MPSRPEVGFNFHTERPSTPIGSRFQKVEKKELGNHFNGEEYTLECGVEDDLGISTTSARSHGRQRCVDDLPSIESTGPPTTPPRRTCTFVLSAVADDGPLRAPHSVGSPLEEGPECAMWSKAMWSIRAPTYSGDPLDLNDLLNSLEKWVFSVNRSMENNAKEQALYHMFP